MTDKELEVLKDSGSAPGLIVQVAFDANYFTPGKIFIVEEYDVKMNYHNGSGVDYQPVKKIREHLAMVEDLCCGKTELHLKCINVGKTESFDKHIRVSEYIHGYYKLYPASITKEGE